MDLRKEKPILKRKKNLRNTILDKHVDYEHFIKMQVQNATARCYKTTMSLVLQFSQIN